MHKGQKHQRMMILGCLLRQNPSGLHRTTSVTLGSLTLEKETGKTEEQASAKRNYIRESLTISTGRGTCLH